MRLIWCIMVHLKLFGEIVHVQLQQKRMFVFTCHFRNPKCFTQIEHNIVHPACIYYCLGSLCVACWLHFWTQGVVSDCFVPQCISSVILPLLNWQARSPISFHSQCEYIHFTMTKLKDHPHAPTQCLISSWAWDQMRLSDCSSLCLHFADELNPISSFQLCDLKRRLNIRIIEFVL